MNSIKPHFILANAKSGSRSFELDVQLKIANIAWDRVWKSKIEKALYFLKNCNSQRATPNLVFDLSTISSRMAELGGLQTRFKCCPLMALKSFPFPQVIELASKYLAGFDVSNWNEYSNISGLNSNTDIFLSNPVLEQSIDKYLSCGCNLKVLADSPHQLSFLQSRAFTQYGVRLNAVSILDSVGLRDASFYSISRFGMTPDEVVNYCRKNRNHGLKGIHLHHGSEKNTFLGYKTLAEVSAKLAEKAGVNFQFLNIGGGMHNLPLSKVTELIQEIRSFLNDETTIYIEPGRYYSVGAGFASGIIQNAFEREGILYLITELSSKCHLRWSEPKLILPIPEKANGMKVIRICGPSCYESDFIGQYYVPDHPTIEKCFKVGKRIKFANVSGYSAAWNTGFNGINPAQIKFI